MFCLETSRISDGCLITFTSLGSGTTCDVLIVSSVGFSLAVIPDEVDFSLIASVFPNRSLAFSASFAAHFLAYQRKMSWAMISSMSGNKTNA